MESAYWHQVMRRRFTRRDTLKGLAGAGLVIGGAACGTTTVTPTATPPPAAAAAATSVPTAAAPAAMPTPQAKRGGIFRLAVPAGPPHLNPHITASPIVAGYGTGLWFSRVLKLDVTKPQPSTVVAGDVAESWDQPDDLTYVFKIRPNVKFHNKAPVSGRLMTVEDVIYSLDRIRAPGQPNAATLDAISKLEAVDKATLKITLKAPSADFLIGLAGYSNGIVPKEMVDLKGDLKTAEAAIGTGAFMVDKFEPQGTTTLVRNPDYFLAGQPYLDGYNFIVVPDPASMQAAFRTGLTEMIPLGQVTVQDAEQLKKTNPTTQFPTFKLYSGMQLGMRADKAPYSDVRVRQAVYKAIDAETMYKTALGSGWLAVGVPMPSQDWNLTQDELSRIYKRDVDAAKQLLKSAGLDNGLDMTIVLASSGNPNYIAAGEFVVAQLKDANIRATLQLMDTNAYTARLSNGEFEVEMGIPGGLPSADQELFGRYHSKGPRNFHKQNDPKLDQMIEQQTLLGRKPDDRKKLLQDIQRLILDQAYMRHLHNWDNPVALAPFVRNFQAGGFLSQEQTRFNEAWFDK